MKYLEYALGIIFRPRKTISGLIDNPHRFQIGFFGVLALGILYAATAFLRYARGMLPLTAPFVRLPLETYYLYEGFFNLPVALAGWVLMGSGIYLTIPQREHSYRDLLGVIGLPYGVLALPLMWLPETIAAIAGPCIWNTNWWIAMTPVRVAVGTLWLYIVCAFAIREFYGLRLTWSLLYTLVGLIAALSISAVFIR